MDIKTKETYSEVYSILNLLGESYITKLPKSLYNMIIEENGFNLSGGERQRLILARSIINDFNILLIDEATNQIDVSLERKILKKIFNKFQDKTIISVSHRLENMDLFDKIIKIEDGKIKEIIENG